MHFLDFFAIVEQDRDILNPISPEKLWRAAEYAGLRDGLSVLDIGSGKGAMLRQWAQKWHITATGVEPNPAFVRAARALAEEQRVAQHLTFWEGNALDFVPDAGGYDVLTCLGAPFAIGSFSEAASWMAAQTKAGGSVIMGDVYLKAPAPAEAQGQWWASEPTLAEKVAQFNAAGLELIGLTTSSTADWDHYSSLMWSAVSRWAAESPDHPDRAEVLQKVREGRANYLRWEREYVDWAVLVGREGR